MKPIARFTYNHQLTFAALRPKRRGRWLFLALLLPLIGGAAAYTFTRLVTSHAAKPATVSSATEAIAAARAVAPAATPAQPSGTKVDVVVRRNDTIEGIFRHLKLSAADLNTLLNLPGVGNIFKQLKPGDKMTVVHDGAMLHAINRHISESEVLSVTRHESGFAAERIVTLN